MAVVMGIESSCDETAAAVVRGRRVLSHQLASSADLQARYGGVVPEVAARRHAEVLPALVDLALADAGLAPDAVDAVAVTVGPGLLGSLLVGMTAAKALALAWRKPLVPVHHLEAHLYANAVEAPLKFPALALLVSGGHTGLWLWQGHGRLRLLGQTRDDAAGEAIDKGARRLGLPYPGGPALERLALAAPATERRLPVARPKGAALDFSFSGLKTALMRGLESAPDDRAGWAAALLDAVARALVDRVDRAQRQTGALRLYLAGGVAANRQVREHLGGWAAERGVAFHVPPRWLCTDNGVMVAVAGGEGFRRGVVAPLSVAPRTPYPLGE